MLNIHHPPCGPIRPCSSAPAVFASSTTGTASDMSATIAGAGHLAHHPSLLPVPDTPTGPSRWAGQGDRRAISPVQSSLQHLPGRRTPPPRRVPNNHQRNLAVTPVYIVPGQVFPTSSAPPSAGTTPADQEQTTCARRRLARQPDLQPGQPGIPQSSSGSASADGKKQMQPSPNAGTTADGPVDVADGPSPVVDAPTPIVDAGADGRRSVSGGGCTVTPSAGGGTALVPLVLGLLVLGRRRP